MLLLLYLPACGQAVGCGVCDTPELWCGAAGLCARVHACAGAAESLHTYMYILSIVSYYLLLFNAIYHNSNKSLIPLS